MTFDAGADITGDFGICNEMDAAESIDDMQCDDFVGYTSTHTRVSFGMTAPTCSPSTAPRGTPLGPPTPPSWPACDSLDVAAGPF